MKQVAEQDAERAKFVVMKAEQVGPCRFSNAVHVGVEDMSYLPASGPPYPSPFFKRARRLTQMVILTEW